MSLPMCIATSKGTGLPCGNRAVPGTTVCRFHGAGAPAVRAAADRQHAADQASAAAAALVAELDLTATPADPTEVVLQAMTISFTQASLHRQQLARLAATGADPYVRLDHRGREYPAARALLEQAERRLAADIAAKAVGAGLAERLVQLEERRVDLMIDALKWVLSEVQTRVSERLGHDLPELEGEVVGPLMHEALTRFGGEVA